MIGRSCLTFEEINTLLVEIECVVNARPITNIKHDQDGINVAFSPSHLILYMDSAYIQSPIKATKKT